MTGPLKVLMISPRISGIGGISQHVSTLVSMLRADGHQVDVMSVEGLLHIPVKGLYNPSFTASSALLSLWRTAARHRKYDVAHAHNFPSWPAAAVAKAGVKVLTTHGVFSAQHRQLHGTVAGGLAGWLETRWGRQADILTCVSKAGIEYYARRGIRAAWIPNAVDVAAMPAEGIRIASRQAIFVGRLSYEKGIDVLVRAMAKIDSGITVVVLGSGGEEALVKEAAGRYPNLRYLGYQPHDMALRYIRGSDALVIPSRQEGLPTVMLEAMAMKVPVIASDIPEITDVTRSVSLFKAEDPAALASAVNDNATDGRGMAEAALIEVNENYRWDGVYRKYLDVYEGRATG